MFYLSGHETLIIVLVFAFLFVGIPLLSFVASKFTRRVRMKIKGWLSSFRRRPDA